MLPIPEGREKWPPEVAIYASVSKKTYQSAKYLNVFIILFLSSGYFLLHSNNFGVFQIFLVGILSNSTGILQEFRPEFPTKK